MSKKAEKKNPDVSCHLALSGLPPVLSSSCHPVLSPLAIPLPLRENAGGPEATMGREAAWQGGWGGIFALPPPPHHTSPGGGFYRNGTDAKNAGNACQKRKQISKFLRKSPPKNVAENVKKLQS